MISQRSAAGRIQNILITTLRFLVMLTMIVRVVFVFLLAASVLAGCARRSDEVTGEWMASVERAGSVTTVRTLHGSVWRATAVLEEEASIGSAAGGEAYLLGNIVGLTSDGERIYVLDDQVPVLRVYGMNGDHLIDIGRGGEGPGEFRNPLGVAVSPADGLVYVHDGSQGRINIYTPDGEVFDTVRTRPFNTYVNQITLTPEGVPYIPQLLNPGASLNLWRTGMVGYGPGGAAIDTLAPPEYGFDPPRLPARGERSSSNNPVPFSPRVVWTMSPTRAVVSGISESYRFELRQPDGSITVIEKAPWDPVPVEEDEARWHRKFLILMNRLVEPGWVWRGPPVPGHKPAYSQFVCDRNHRIWIIRPGPGERVEGGTEDSPDVMDFWRNPLWRDTVLVDVFEESGRYLGRVKPPPGIRFFLPQAYIDGDMVIAVVEAADGVSYVKRFRLLLPEDASDN